MKKKGNFFHGDDNFTTKLGLLWHVLEINDKNQCFQKS